MPNRIAIIPKDSIIRIKYKNIKNYEKPSFYISFEIKTENV